MTKFIILFLFSLVFQLYTVTAGFPDPDVKTESRESALERMQKEVAELKIYIRNIWADEFDYVDAYKLSVNAIVDSTMDSIKNALDYLDNLVKDATATAKQSSKNISSCIINETKAKESVKTNTISQCSKTWNFKDVEKYFDQFNNLDANSGASITKCDQKFPSDDSQFQDCVMKDLEDYRKSAEDIQDTLEELDEEIYTHAVECIEDKSEELETNIANIAEIFRKCVEEVSEQMSS